MTWVMPKPTPSEKLESVGWEEEQHTGPPWKHLQALNKREKKVHTHCPGHHASAVTFHIKNQI